MSSRGLVRLPVSSPSRRLLLHVRVCSSVSVSVAVDWIWSPSEGAEGKSSCPPEFENKMGEDREEWIDFLAL